jgi:hypothetical protein
VRLVSWLLTESCLPSSRPLFGACLVILCRRISAMAGYSIRQYVDRVRVTSLENHSRVQFHFEL